MTGDTQVYWPWDSISTLVCFMSWPGCVERFEPCSFSSGFSVMNQPAVLSTPGSGELASPDHVTSRTRDPSLSVNELILISLANQHFWICSVALVGCRFWRYFGVDLLPLGYLFPLALVHVPESWDTPLRLPLIRLHLWRRICSSSTLWILTVGRGYQSGAPQLPFLPEILSKVLLPFSNKVFFF